MHVTVESLAGRPLVNGIKLKRSSGRCDLE